MCLFIMMSVYKFCIAKNWKNGGSIKCLKDFDIIKVEIVSKLKKQTFFKVLTLYLRCEQKINKKYSERA